MTAPPFQTEWVAACHVHTHFSDGTGDLSRITSDASAAGADVVVVADHNTLAPLRAGWQGWRNGVLVLVGCEIGRSHAPHCVALNVSHCRGFARLSEEEYLCGVAAQGGFGVAAHPAGVRSRLLGLRHRPWTSFSHPALRGFELWSYPHDWVQSVLDGRCLNPFHAFRRPGSLLRGPRGSLLAAWDRATQTRRLSAIGAIDCHSARFDLRDAEFMSYRHMFQALRTHVFVDTPARDDGAASRVLDALSEGRCFVGLDELAPSWGARFWATAASGNALCMGQESAFDGLAELRAKTPARAEIRLIHDGRPAGVWKAAEVRFEARQPGVYRFEARLGGKPWIYANPFYLRARP